MALKLLVFTLEHSDPTLDKRLNLDYFFLKHSNLLELLLFLPRGEQSLGLLP